MPKIVIISSDNTGHGHTSIATSLIEQLPQHPDVEIKVVQGFRLMGKTMHSASGIYGPLTRYSKKLWECSFELSQRTPDATRNTTRLLIHDNFMRMLQREHPDLILTVHSLFTGSVIDILEKYNLKIPHVTVIADFMDLHNGWYEPRSALTVCPLEEAATLCKMHGCAPERLVVTGFPARRQFTDAARGFERGDFPTGRPLRFLIMSGGEGSGSLLSYAATLLDEFDCEVTVICGRNARLRQRLERTIGAAHPDRLHALGFVRDVETYMFGNDIMIARGSPNSVTEAVDCNIPIVCVGALPGQEEHNPLLLERYDLGRVCDDKKRLAQVVRMLIDNGGEDWKRVRDAQAKWRRLDAAADIMNAVCAILKPLDYTVPEFRLINPLHDRIERRRQLREPTGKRNAFFE